MPPRFPAVIKREVSRWALIILDGVVVVVVVGWGA